jgi:hypothetical protein
MVAPRVSRIEGVTELASHLLVFLVAELVEIH